MRPARGQQDGEAVRGSWVVHFGEGIDIGSLARRLTWRFGEEIDIGILEQAGRLGSGTRGTRRSEARQHELRPDLRGLVGMMANPSSGGAGREVHPQPYPV
jgi:hypothetical protein